MHSQLPYSRMLTNVSALIRGQHLRADTFRKEDDLPHKA